MKKINIIYTFLLVVSGLLTLNSCKKQLNALPSQSVVDGNVVVDQNSAEVTLNGAYYRFVDAKTVLSVLSHNWSVAQELHPSMMAGWMKNGMGTVNYDVNTFTPISLSDWSYAYALLNAANGTISGVENLDDSKFSNNRKNEILAEGKFLRAFAHFHLLTFFSEWYDINSKYGVLLRKEPIAFGGTKSNTRSTVAESYDYILQDLDYAIANAAENRPVYYTNKAAAQLLKLRVLMCRGQAADYTSAIAIADQIISNPKYALEDNVEDLFKTKGLASSEVILGIQPYANQRSRMAAYEFVQSSVFIASPELRQLFQDDPRLSWMFVPCTNATVKTYNPDPYYLSKYAGAKYEEAIPMRLTEVYLLKAEAIARSGGSLEEARNILKLIMSKAGVTDFTAIDDAVGADEVIYQVLLEITRNLVSENGADWLALLRQPFSVVQTVKPALLKEEYRIYPVPADEFRLNPEFGDQNPGYPKE